jgi:hypothetical protein
MRTNDRLLVLAVNRKRKAVKPPRDASKLPVEPRFREQTEHDAVQTLEDNVLGHARRRFRPTELPIERSHSVDVAARKRDRVDPHGQPDHRHRSRRSRW